MFHELDLLGRIALVAGLMARHDLLQHRDDLFLGRHDLVEQSQWPGDRLRGKQILLERPEHRGPLFHQHLEDPLLLLLVVDGLVVHHPEAAQEAVERLGRAVLGQRLQGLQPVRRLRPLVDRAGDVLLARAQVAAILRKQIENAHNLSARESIRPARSAPREKRRPAQRSATARRSVSTRTSNRSGFTRHSKSASGEGNAVRPTTGMSASAGWLRWRARKVSPSMTGIMMSRTMTSG